MRCRGGGGELAAARKAPVRAGRLRGGRLTKGMGGRPGREQLEPRDPCSVKPAPAAWGMEAGTQAWQREAGAGKGRDWAVWASAEAAEAGAGAGSEAGVARAGMATSAASRRHCRLGEGSCNKAEDQLAGKPGL